MVCISKIRETHIDCPKDDPWTAARQVIGTFPSDFMDDRDQPSWDDAPDREEL